MYNLRLQRQITKYLRDASLPDEFAELFQAISNTYDGFDESSNGVVGESRTLGDEGTAKPREGRADGTDNTMPISGEPVADTQKLIHAEDAFFRQLAEKSADVIIRYDADGRARYISPSSQALFGYRQEELLGKTPFDIMHREDVRRIRVGLERGIRGGKRFTLDARIRLASGEYRWFETTAHPIIDIETGRVLELHTSARDISDRKQTEMELRTVYSRIEALVQSLHGGILVEDETRHIGVINRKFVEMFGIPVPPEALIGTDCSQAAEQSKGLFADPDEFVRRIDWILAQKKPVVGDEIEMADGRVLERDYIPITVDGQYAGHLWHYRDITERNLSENAIRTLNTELQKTNELLRQERDRAEENVKALEKLNAMKSEFVSSVSHEFHTPLASIIGFAQSLAIDPDLPAETRDEFLRIIQDEGKRLSSMVEQVLDISRIESGRSQIQPIDMNVVPLLARSLEGIAKVAAAKDLRLRMNTEAVEMTARVDKDAFDKIMRQILDNAVRYTPNGGCIVVEAEEFTDGIAVSVTDTGIGIPEEDLPFVLDTFYRVHRHGTEHRGTGLGLALVRRLVELHGGTVAVESRLEEGTRVTIHLP